MFSFCLTLIFVSVLLETRTWFMKWFINVSFHEIVVGLCCVTRHFEMLFYFLWLRMRIKFSDLYICVGFIIIYPWIVLIMMVTMIMEGKTDEEVFWLI